MHQADCWGKDDFCMERCCRNVGREDMFTAETKDKLLPRDSPMEGLVTGNRAINIAAIRAEGTYANI